MKLVLGEIKELGDYSAKQLRRHRTTRAVVIVSGALVPVLATVSAVPRVVLGLFGALAVVTEGVGQLFQYLASALNAMKTANALEREVNLFSVAAGRYAITRPQAFKLFAETVEDIRGSADQAFLDTWRRKPATVEEQSDGGAESGGAPRDIEAK